MIMICFFFLALSSVLELEAKRYFQRVKRAICAPRARRFSSYRKNRFGSGVDGVKEVIKKGDKEKASISKG